MCLALPKAAAAPARVICCAGAGDGSVTESPATPGGQPAGSRAAAKTPPTAAAPAPVLQVGTEEVTALQGDLQELKLKPRSEMVSCRAAPSAYSVSCCQVRPSCRSSSRTARW